MTGEEVEGVIEKMAEQLGVAVTELEPLAEETVRQVALRGLVWGVGTLLIALLLAGIAAWSGVKAKQRRGEMERTDDGLHIFYMISVVLLAVGAIVALGIGVSHLGDWVAPIPRLLGK